MKVLLGLDLGTKTCGVAISESLIISSGLTTIYFNNENYGECLKQLKPIILEYKVTTIILGYPLHSDNSIGTRAKASIDFKELIEKKCGLEVILVDERYSTKEALESFTLKSNIKKEKKKKDMIAAQIILQSYLNSIN
jgi:putative Holliday junction resolvase